MILLNSDGYLWWSREDNYVRKCSRICPSWSRLWKLKMCPSRGSMGMLASSSHRRPSSYLPSTSQRLQPPNSSVKLVQLSCSPNWGCKHSYACWSISNGQLMIGLSMDWCRLASDGWVMFASNTFAHLQKEIVINNPWVHPVAISSAIAELV